MRPELAELRRWLIKARHDRSAAMKILTPDCEEFDAAAFHCQQAVEKLLKAWLVFRRRPFEKVHDLGLLLYYCASEDRAFETLRDAIEPLTVYAVAFRYPGPADPTRGDVEEALRTVAMVWDFVTARMPEEAVR
jgi:HEPN domain-containing protein